VKDSSSNLKKMKMQLGKLSGCDGIRFIKFFPLIRFVHLTLPRPATEMFTFIKKYPNGNFCSCSTQVCRQCTLFISPFCAAKINREFFFAPKLFHFQCIVAKCSTSLAHKRDKLKLRWDDSQNIGEQKREFHTWK
jgi:hypothetical protein